MKDKNLIMLLFIALFTLSLTRPLYHGITFVYDGDTVLMDTGERVRYLGIDAPEIGYEGKKSEFMALSSRDYNIRLVGQRRVRLEFDQEKNDRHGRLLAYVFLETGEMVNALMVRRGFAHVMVKGPNLKYFDLLLHDQRLAMGEKLGIWRKKSLTKEKHYIGSGKSYRFHRPRCSFGNKIPSSNLVRFKNRRDAFWAGFSPCRRCRP